MAFFLRKMMQKVEGDVEFSGNGDTSEGEGTASVTSALDRIPSRTQLDDMI
jgi:hypothetical protein